MNLDQMRAFVAVAEAGGFSRAAGSAASTQPTLSRQIQGLEESLGRQVFHRLGRRIALTAFGETALARARAILAQADAFAASAHAPEGTASGPLRIGAADSVVLGRFPALLRRFLRRHPRVTVDVHTAGSPEILAWVREGRCDAGLCMLPDASPGLLMHRLWEDRFCALVPPRHRLAHRTAALADFAHERQLVIRTGTLSHQSITTAFQRAGLALVAAMSFDTFSLVVSFVAAGLGVGVASEIVALPALRRRQVARVRIREIDALSRNLGVVHHAERRVEGALAALLEEIDRRTASGSSS